MDLGQLAFFAFLFFSIGMAVAYLILKLAGYEKTTANSKPENPLPGQSESGEVRQVRLEKAAGLLLVEMTDGKRLELKLKEGAQIEPALTATPAVEIKLPAEPTAAAPRPPAPSPLQVNPAPVWHEPEAERPKISVVDSFVRVVQSANTQPNLPPLSIAQQIDAVLQQQIANTPAKQRGLRLVDLSDHTLGVLVDRQTYAGIDAVPDEHLRGLIQAAITEWQAQNQQR